jgi:two-component system response regulator AtoC
MSRILIADDDKAIGRSFFSVLSKMGLEAIAAGTGDEALKVIQGGDISLVFLDLKLPDMDGLQVLKRIKDIDDSILVIIITGYATIESAVEAMRLGAYDYIKKPFKSDAVKIITKLALEKISLSRQVESLHFQKKARNDDHEMIGSCDKIRDIRRQIAKVAGTNTTILVEGESGTGKEIIAKLVHKNSSRDSGPLIHVNCSAVPDNLLESEFFGYEKGAFTGALNRKRGLLEQASGGTLHLDEVGDMPLSLQAKLLRILEERRFRRIGGTGEIGLDIRVVASTNKNLLEEIEKENFRLDLYYRLNTFLINVPPLRERGHDIILLADYWIKKNNREFGKNVQVISPEAQKILLSYYWPGNVRELRNVVERTVLLLPMEVRVLLPEHMPFGNSPGAWSSRKTDHLSDVSSLDFQLDEGLDYYEVTENISNQVKKRLIVKALQLTGGNRTKAAEVLHLSRSALWREMAKIERWQERDSVSEQ